MGFIVTPSAPSGTDVVYKLVEVLDLTDAGQRTTSNLSAYKEVLLQFNNSLAGNVIYMDGATANSYELNYTTSGGTFSVVTGTTTWSGSPSNGYIYAWEDAGKTLVMCVGHSYEANVLFRGECVGTITTFTTPSTIGTLKVYARSD